MRYQTNQSLNYTHNHITLNHKNSLHNCKICYQGGVYIKHIVTKVEYCTYCTYWRYWRYCYQGGQGASWFPWMATDTTYQNKKSWHHNLILSIMVGWLNYNFDGTSTIWSFLKMISFRFFDWKSTFANLILCLQTSESCNSGILFIWLIHRLPGRMLLRQRYFCKYSSKQEHKYVCHQNCWQRCRLSERPFNQRIPIQSWDLQKHEKLQKT